MKKITRLLSAVLITVSLLSTIPVSASSSTTSITVYNWGQYISDGTDGYIDVNKAFTEATGIEVNYITYDTNESLYTKLKTGGSTYDVIIPSDYMVAKLIEEGLVQEINFDNIPNYEYIDDEYKNLEYDPDNLYSVPYTWGTVGIIYNTQYVDEADVGSWDLLWNEKYADKILMFDNPRDAFAIAQTLLGQDVNDFTTEELEEARDLLIEQKPLVQQYVMDQIYDKMIRGEAYIAPYYAGDYLWMLDENEDLAFYFPEEGYNLFVDAMCIPTSSENKEAAELYINFLCNPEISGENLDYLGYSTPISEAKQYMDEDMANSEIAYPSEEVLENTFSFLALDDETNTLMDSYWLEVKTAEEDSSSTMLIVGAAVAVIAVVGFIMMNNKKKAQAKANRGKSSN